MVVFATRLNKSIPGDEVGLFNPRRLSTAILDAFANFHDGSMFIAHGRTSDSFHSRLEHWCSCGNSIRSQRTCAGELRKCYAAPAYAAPATAATTVIIVNPAAAYRAPSTQRHRWDPGITTMHPVIRAATGAPGIGAATVRPALRESRQTRLFARPFAFKRSCRCVSIPAQGLWNNSRLCITLCVSTNAKTNRHLDK
jgi:hypothetical protein